MAKSSQSSAGDSFDSSENLNTTYHPNAIRALQSIKADMQKLIDRIDAAIVSSPPPYVPPPVVSAVVQHGAVWSDYADVYVTPSLGASVVGRVAKGAVLPVVADPSTDSGNTWWKITDGDFKDKFVTGRTLTMQ
jgi:hypothetical protein